MEQTQSMIGLTLEGFQVFDKPTYIPLEGLTLLFGPNSAGKSAIQDAIELCGALLHTDSRYPLPDWAQRHWRRTGDANNPYAEKMCVGMKFTTEAHLPHVVPGAIDRELMIEQELKKSLQVESKWKFLEHESISHEDEDEDENSFLDGRNWTYEFSIDSELLLLYQNKKGSIEVNLNHWLLRSIEKKIDFAKVAENHPNETSFQNGVFIIKDGLAGFNPEGARDDPNWLQYRFNFGQAALLFEAVKEISLLLGTTLFFTFEAASYGTYLVNASRKIPTSDELTFELARGDKPNYWPLQNDRLYKSLPEGNQQYLPLAQSLTSELRGGKDKALAENVNRALSDHLFLEQGYRLDFDFNVLLSKANSAAVQKGVKLDISEFRYLVELFLRDGRGRKHLFEDVGSGIGYVLPVLCSAFSANNCFIQQPELHLHPALQAALGDVFIEASGLSKQVLVETHSEHMLLRILKRIRQTHLQTNIAPELKINADSVCVLYFDPSPDGKTTVKRLRITEDGEFMDRWPRGFFAERDQELLDE